MKIVQFERSHSAEKFERGPFEVFCVHSIANHQKIKGGPFGNIKKVFREKSHKSEKKGREVS